MLAERAKIYFVHQKEGEELLDNISYDQTGKINLNGIYNRDEPVSYFSALSRLGYRIPQEAKPRFESLIEARRRSAQSEAIKVIDLGCSYGVNGALLKHGLSMDDLYERYAAGPDNAGALLARDRDLYAEPADAGLEMVGVDPAVRAVSYAVDAGMLDAGITTNLEAGDPMAKDVAALENADLIISTGCVGYVTETSLERLLETSIESKPWMAHFVLRMFDFGAPEDMLSSHGYVTEKVEGLFPQRRFASSEEQEHVLGNLDQLDIDASGAEATGWYFAELHVSRPQEIVQSVPLDRILRSDAFQPA